VYKHSLDIAHRLPGDVKFSSCSEYRPNGPEDPVKSIQGSYFFLCRSAGWWPHILISYQH